jgi:ADP-ribose pyrophosphatase YjhB (NUDIX family)
MSARLSGWTASDDRLDLELQPARWSLRLIGEATDSLAVLCVARDTDGRWLAGRRASWLASWPERWALGAGGAVDLGEPAANALTRELDEEWSVQPERLSVEALVRMPSNVVLLIGLAWLPEGAEVVRDEEHDDHAWWPADVSDWPDEADEPLRRVGQLLAARG